MAGAYGPRARRAKARASTSRCRGRAHERVLRAARNPAGRGQPGRRRDDAARAAQAQPRQPAALGQGRRGSPRLPVLPRPVRRPRPRPPAQAGAARHQDAQGRRHRGAAPDQGLGAEDGAGGGDDLLQRGARRGRELSPRRQQLHRQAGGLRGVPRHRDEDRPVLGAHQPGAAVSAPTIRVLLTEDVVSDAELEVRELKRAGLRLTHRIVDSEESFTRALQEFSPDVILSDFSMPGFDGMAALSIAREICPDTPFVFVSGTIGEEYAIRALKNGATDYVLKSNLVRLPATVERAIAEARARRERRRTEAELEIARERLTSIFTSLPDMLWSVDANTDQIEYASPASKEIFGHSPDEFLHNQDLWLEVVHGEDRPRVRAAWDKVRRGEAYEIEYRTVRPDGTVRWVNDRGRQIRDAAGTVERIDGITRDVTQRVEARNRIERLSRIRELLGALNSSIVRVRERDLLFDELCRIAVSRGGFVLARIIAIDAAGKASIAATTERDPAVFQAMLDGYNRDPSAADSLLAKALRSGQQVISND